MYQDQFYRRYVKTKFLDLIISQIGGNQNIVGKFAAIGDQHGTVTLLELCDSLYMTGGDNKEKEIIGDVRKLIHNRFP